MWRGAVALRSSRSSSRSAGASIAQYVRDALAPAAARLDYAVLAHFHADHIGGIHDVGDRMPIAALIDRGHEYLTPPDTDPTFRQYRAFLQVQGARGTRPEAIRVGRAARPGRAGGWAGRAGGS